MAFDPFGDRDTRGYLRNRLGTKDAALISRLEAHAFSANVLPTLAALKSAPTVSYDQVLDTHRRLFSSVYPWAGQDRATLTPDIAIAKGGVAGLFSHPADVRRATDYALGMGLDPRSLRTKPGEVFGALAYAYPVLVMLNWKRDRALELIAALGAARYSPRGHSGHSQERR